MTDILGVHGIAQQQSGRNQLLDKWGPALRDGIERASGGQGRQLDLELAFYGDLFISPSDAGQAVKGSLADVEEVSDADVRFLTAAAAEVVPEPLPDTAWEEKGFGRVPTPLQPVVRRLAVRLNTQAALLFVRALRQVRLYLDDEVLAEQVRTRVVCAVEGPLAVLIGHSLGSVVAYETLALTPNLRVGTLITVGSPLGIRTVAERVRGQRSAGRAPWAPDQVRRWVNIYDPADAVACAGPLSRLWPHVEDYEVGNEGQPHAIERYLGKAVTGRIVLETLGARGDGR